MKKLENKTTEIPKGEKEFLKYSDIISNICDVPPKDGWTTTIMRARIKIQNDVKDCGDTIELEDADAGAVAVLVKNMTWNIKHIDLIVFEEDVLKAF